MIKPVTFLSHTTFGGLRLFKAYATVLEMYGFSWFQLKVLCFREHVYSPGKFVKKANHLANCVQVTSTSKKSDVAKFATCSEPI